MSPSRILALNASAQIFISSLLGVYMVLELQPWWRWRGKEGRSRHLLSTHLDWIQLALMQLGAAFVLDRFVPSSDNRTAVMSAWLLVFGGWMNALPYLGRAFGINAFVFGGSVKQRIAAALAGSSVLAILAAWALIISATVP
jgi:hypothetical protein